MLARFRAALPAIVILPLLAATLHGQYEGATPIDSRLEKGFSTIEPDQCREWLTVLASDDFAGRATGTEGYEKAARFVAARFEEFGLEPIGDDGTYFQNVPFRRTTLDPQATRITIPGTDFSVSPGDGLSFTGLRDVVETEAPVLFVAADNPHARMPDADVLDGKIVVVATGGERLPRALYRQLRLSRAIAYLRVMDEVAPPRPSVSRAGRERSRRRRSSRAVGGAITRAAAARLAAALGVDDSFVDPQSGKDALQVTETEKPARLTIRTKTEDIGVPNVVGLVRGSDPSLAHEVVICGSHLDHIGVSPNGQINNGADDDGSGSTALLAVARAVAANPAKPKRSIMFIAVCGEEMGLIGSAWYVDHPIFPIEDTICELQMDMVGRNEEKGKEKPEDNVRTTHLVGSKRLSMELHEKILELNRHIGFEFEYDEEGVYTRSDHYNFAKKGIPIAFFFSGFHPDYHRPTDTVEKINFEKIANTARLVYLTAFTVADQPQRLRVDKGPLKNTDDADSGDNRDR